MASKEAYLSQLQNLLPPGQAWTREPNTTLTAVLKVIASELARVDGRAHDLVNESDPRKTNEMLTDWEREVGLPDICSSLAATLQERRLRVVEKLTRKGSQSRAYYMAIAEALGYEIELTEFRPFIAGISHCGGLDILNGGHSVRHYWRVKVLEPRLTYFRTGVSRCGERLLSIMRADDLECILNYLKPAHTQLIFAYEGV